MTTRTVLLIVLGLLLALGGYYGWREWRKDNCSAGGGEWNQSGGYCGSRT